MTHARLRSTIPALSVPPIESDDLTVMCEITLDVETVGVVFVKPGLDRVLC